MSDTPRLLTLRRPSGETTISWGNLATDFGAPAGGTGTPTGDFEAFVAMREWAFEQEGWVGLFMPPGSSYYGSHGSYPAVGGMDATSNAPFYGIPKLIVYGYGASINGPYSNLTNDINTERARIYTVSAGASTVELMDGDDASLFTVGRMVMVAGLDLMGYGFPPNSHFFEYRRITDITGAVINFDRPLKYSYRDDWPTWNTGNEFGLGTIGAASLVRCHQGWDCEHQIWGLRSTYAEQVYYFTRKTLLVDVESDGQGWITGASEDHRIINQRHTANQLELDKSSVLSVIENYPSPYNILVQSSTIEDLRIRGGISPILGTSKRTTIEGGSSPVMVFGPVFGNSEKVIVRERSIASIPQQNNPGQAWTLGTSLTYQGDGVFKWLGTSPPAWAVPGAVGYILTEESQLFHTPFRIIDQRQVGDDKLIFTTLTGETLPTVGSETNYQLCRCSAPDLTVIDCTGSEAAVELSLAPPNSPFGVFTRRTYTGAEYSEVGVPTGFVMGRMIHAKFNVTQPYTGVAPNYNLHLGQFHYRVINPDMSITNVQSDGFVINLKEAGERVITPEGVTGAQSGDANLTGLTGGVWIPRPFDIFFGASGNPVNISGEDAGVRPIVTVEVLTDQEIPAAA